MFSDWRKFVETDQHTGQFINKNDLPSSFPHDIFYLPIFTRAVVIIYHWKFCWRMKLPIMYVCQSQVLVNVWWHRLTKWKTTQKFMNTAVVWRVFLKFNHFVESGIKIFHYSHQVKLVLFKWVGLQIFRGEGREKIPFSETSASSS